MTAPFDAVAQRYESLWSNAPAGRHQRESVWRRIDPLFGAGDRVLDIGCGTGDDAVHLAARGIRVTAIDESPEMVAIARGRGVDARVMRVQQLADMRESFDGVLSNFAVLNCAGSLAAVAEALSARVVRGGQAALCLFGKCCAWEIAWHLSRGDPEKAFRRFRPQTAAATLGVRVSYPGAGPVARAFAPWFRLVSWEGIGLAVPPSYVPVSHDAAARLASIDRRLAHLPLLRALADHRLYIFERL
jgi:SAM-dependent methyltransferase